MKTKTYKGLFIFAAIVLLTGCNMSRWCADRYPPQVITEIHEIVRDSVITIEIKPDTVITTDTVTVEVETGLVQMPIKTLETELCRATSVVINSQHFFDLYQKPFRIDTVIQYRETFVTDTVIVPERYTTWWDRLWIGLGKVLLAVVVGFVGYMVVARRL